MLRRALSGLVVGVAGLGLALAGPASAQPVAEPAPTNSVGPADAHAVASQPVASLMSPAAATGGSAGMAVPAQSAAPIAGVPAPCPATHPWPEGARQVDVLAALSRNTGFQLTGPDWNNPAYLPMVKIVWQTLDGLSCTDYVRHVTSLHHGFSLNAAPISGYAWGDWGLTKPGATTLDFAKWTQALKAKDPGRLVRILAHELGHAWDSDRDGSSYWNTYVALQKKLGPISDYGRRSVDENFSEIVGYYVARCAASNPYDNPKFKPYYSFVQQTVFGGRQFGGAPGSRANCPVGR